jgi:hypothetical protein
MSETPMLTEESRQALADKLRSLEGEELLLALRFIGPVQIGPNAFGNGPVQLQGTMASVSDTGLLLTIAGTINAPQAGLVQCEQSVLLDDILTVTKVGTVMATEPKPSLVTP